MILSYAKCKLALSTSGFWKTNDERLYSHDFFEYHFSNEHLLEELE